MLPCLKRLGGLRNQYDRRSCRNLDLLATDCQLRTRARVAYGAVRHARTGLRLGGGRDRTVCHAAVGRRAALSRLHVAALRQTAEDLGENLDIRSMLLAVGPLDGPNADIAVLRDVAHVGRLASVDGSGLNQVNGDRSLLRLEVYFRGADADHGSPDGSDTGREGLAESGRSGDCGDGEEGCRAK